MTKTTLTLLCVIAMAGEGAADSRSSPSYTVTTESSSSGGRSAAGVYSHDSATGGGGLSTVGAYTAKTGYVGQLYDPAVLELQATPLTLDEAGTRQLSARLRMDDDTTLPVPGTDVVWSVASGPVSSIDINGLASAARVSADTPAQVEGLHLGLTGALTLTVLNVDDDDLGTYAGDGLDDAWQLLHFGVDNPLAAPSVDADQNGQDNRFEFLAGTIPTDPQSFFALEPSAPTGSPFTLRLSLVVPGTHYRLLRTTSLTSEDPWVEVTDFTVATPQTDFPVTDPEPPAGRAFYRISLEQE